MFSWTNILSVAIATVAVFVGRAEAQQVWHERLISPIGHSFPARQTPRPTAVLFADALEGNHGGSSWLPETPSEPTVQKTSPITQAYWAAQPSGNFMSPNGVSTGMGDSARFDTIFRGNTRDFDVGLNLYSAPKFEGGLIVFGREVAMKIGGYVKADFIHDFDPIDSTDSFDTTTIPVDAPPRTNSSYHAKQSRLSFDTRWAADERLIRIYVEGDFFSDDSHFRLRHAFGESGRLLVGKTWTTFTDVAAAPATLDFEGSVSGVNRRQAQARWTQPLLDGGLLWAVAVEDTRFIIDAPAVLMVQPRSPSPDFVTHLRWEPEWGQFQAAALFRRVGGQLPQGPVNTENAWGFNFAGVLLLTDNTKFYSQVVFGKGIGSYRDLPDAAPSVTGAATLLPMFGWMVGVTHDWNDALSSNFTYAENRLSNTQVQSPDSVHETSYLAANLIWSPFDRVKVGAEYLYGIRQNADGQARAANRIQASVIFDLP